jgi:hypothetical protein
MPRVEEVVPDYVMLKDRLTGSSVVEERYTATQVPSSGDNYAVGGSGVRLMIIRVANQNDYIDTSTMVLNFKLGAAGNASGCDLALDDHVMSIVDTINVKIGGQTVEVLNNVSHLINALVQGSMPPDYYQQSGGMEGLYIYDKHNSSRFANADNSPDYNNSSLLRARWTVGNSWLKNGRYYSVPLTLLGICRLPTLFAARNFQDITLEILLRNNFTGCCWQASPQTTASTWPATNTNFLQISDVTLTYDCCRMSADYYALMDNELKMPNGSGVAYPIDTYQVQPALIPATSGSVDAGTATATPYTTANTYGSPTQGGLTRIVVAKGTRFLKGVYGVSKPSASETSTYWRNCSTNGNYSFSSYQVIINSRRYPQLQIQSSAVAFQELQKAYNQLGSVNGGSLINWYNYVGHPFARFATLVAVGNATTDTQANGVNQDTVAVGTKDGSSLGTAAGDEAMFQVGVNLEQFLTNQPDAGGINTSTSGYQIAIELNQCGAWVNPTAAITYSNAAWNNNLLVATNLTHYVFLHFTRVLTLKAGAVEVLD